MRTEYEYTGKAMGTEYAIAIVSADGVRAEKLARSAIEKIQAYEQIFSRFLPTSELSRLNRERNMYVSSTFLETLLEARGLFMRTKGIYNPLVQIARLGYTTSFDALPDVVHIGDTDAPYNIDFTTTHINLEEKSVTLEEGQQLDFGGFLKGYLAHLLCREIMIGGGEDTGVLVNLGGDIATQGLDAEGTPFIVTIYNPILENDDTTIPLHNESLATSGTYKRSWRVGGVETHHVLDASGQSNPETDLVSVSVVHPYGSVAEAYTKVFFALGTEKAMELLKDTACRYLVITNTGTVITNII